MVVSFSHILQNTNQKEELLVLASQGLRNLFINQVLITLTENVLDTFQMEQAEMVI